MSIIQVALLFVLSIYLDICSLWNFCVLSQNLIVPAGTFTLSNLGMFGVDGFDAILPPGQVIDEL